MGEGERDRDVDALSVLPVLRVFALAFVKCNAEASAFAFSSLLFLLFVVCSA